MQELLAKIIEMDSKARKIKEQAQTKKLESEQEVEKLRQQIYDDYIARAKERVEMNISVDRRYAEEDFEAFSKTAEEIKAGLRKNYELNGERLVSEIVERGLA